MRKALLLSILFILASAPIAVSEVDTSAASDETTAESGVATPGTKLEDYTFEDPHGEKKKFKPDTELVLMSFEMDISKQIHKYLEKKDPAFLAEHKTEYVADITPMPSIITWLFAGPKMRKYDFPILLVDDDEFAKRYPIEDGKILALTVGKDRTISGIKYLGSMEDVEKEYFRKPKVTVTNLSNQAEKLGGMSETTTKQ